MSETRIAKAQRRWLRAASHDVRTPLNDIIGMAQVLAKRDLDDDDRQIAQALYQSAKTLYQALSDTIALSALVDGEAAAHPSAHCLRDVLRSEVRDHRDCAQEKGLDLQLAVAPDLPETLIFDAERINHCLAPVIRRAIDVSARSPIQIAVTADKIMDDVLQVRIHVRDRDETASASSMERLFDPPGIAHSTDDSLSRLSLWAAKDALQRSGGDITALSSPGKGSVLTLEFPTEVPPQAAMEDDDPADGPETATALSGTRILLVDDHPTNRQVARMMLEPHGFDIHEVASGRSALDALHQERYDLVLLDILMPGMDGVDTFHAIRQSGRSWAEITVIAVTALADDSAGQTYLDMGMDGYASKPVSEAALLSIIKTGLARGMVRAQQRRSA